MIGEILGGIAEGLGSFVPAFFKALLDGFMSLFLDTSGTDILLNPLGQMAIAFIVIGMVIGFAPKIFGLLKTGWAGRKARKKAKTA